MLRYVIASLFGVFVAQHAAAITLEEYAQHQLEYDDAQVQAKTNELKNKGVGPTPAVQAVPSSPAPSSGGSSSSASSSNADDIYALGIYGIDGQFRAELQIGKNKVSMRIGQVALGWKLESIEDSVVTLVGVSGKTKGVRRQAVFGSSDSGPALLPTGYPGAVYPNGYPSPIPTPNPTMMQAPMPGVAPRIGP